MTYMNNENIVPSSSPYLLINQKANISIENFQQAHTTLILALLEKNLLVQRAAAPR